MEAAGMVKNTYGLKREFIRKNGDRGGVEVT